jgi:hypothetical protein
MSHFLARLVERARGTAPQIEPIIAPRFAPAPMTEIATEVEAPAPAPSRDDITARGNEAPTRKIVRQEIGPPRVEQTADKETIAAPEPEKLLVPQELPVSHPKASIVRRIGPDDVAVPPKINGASPTESLSQASATQPGSTAPARARRVAGGVDPGRLSAVPASRTAAIQPNDSHTEPPVVRVTIGRIEVRAETPASSPRKTSAPARPTLSLDTYLKERKEGRR